MAASTLIAVRRRVKRSREIAEAIHAEQLREEKEKENVEYLRHMYSSTRAWYTAAEGKAQLLLAVNGIFVTILFGILFGKTSVGVGVGHLDLDTWIPMSVSAVALVSAIVCAALSLWSLHGTAKAEFACLGVDPSEPPSYPPKVLWYFGHIAHLQPGAVEKQLRLADRKFEIEVLSYHVIDLARKVFRKHRWVNAGWAFTALALIALVVAGASFAVRAQF